MPRMFFEKEHWLYVNSEKKTENNIYQLPDIFPLNNGNIKKDR